MRGATSCIRMELTAPIVISIHAPHARSDYHIAGLIKRAYIISIHAPHARSDYIWAAAMLCTFSFQSTLLMRGATCVVDDDIPRRVISIHAPHARSDRWREVRPFVSAISIHAPHARSDPGRLTFQAWSCYFNPRSSCEERLKHVALPTVAMISIHAPHARSDRELRTDADILDEISIHAPHARSDLYPSGTCHRRHDFNPRSSCEERRKVQS